MKMRESLDAVVTLNCDAVCPEKVEVRRYDWGDGEEMITLNFVSDTFYAGQSVVGIIRERLRLAWLALRKGNYIHNEIVTNRKALSEFNRKLSEVLDTELLDGFSKTKTFPTTSASSTNTKVCLARPGSSSTYEISLPPVTKKKKQHRRKNRRNK